MNRTRAILTATVVALSSSSVFARIAPTPSCTDTTFSSLASTACAGSSAGNINGTLSETAFIGSEFGGVFSYIGKSDDAQHGPFTSNPTTATNGTLTFDSPLGGVFVIGLMGANRHSFYLFDAVSPVSSLTFESMEGVALNHRSIAQDLSHANLYVAAPVPEPQAYALMMAGLAGVGFVARRRKGSV